MTMTATKTNVLLKIDSTPLSDEPLVLRMQSHGRKLRGSAFPTNPRSKGAVRFRATGGTGGYVFSIEDSSAYDGLPPGLSLNATTGMVTGTPTTVGRFRFRGKVQDSSATVAEEDFTIDIIGRLIGVNVTPVDGEVDIPYSYQFTVTGNTGVVEWTVFSGDLPDGLSLSSSGVLSGTPTTDGYNYFVARAEDLTSSDLLDIPCRVRIWPALSGGFIEEFLGVDPSQFSVPTALRGQPYTINAYSNGNPGLIIRISELPAGFSSTPAGVVTGITYDVRGVHDAIVLTLTDSLGGFFEAGFYLPTAAKQVEIATEENGVDKSPTNPFIKYNFVDGSGTTAHAEPQADGSVDVSFDATGGGDSGGPFGVSVAEVRRITALRAY